MTLLKNIAARTILIWALGKASFNLCVPGFVSSCAGSWRQFSMTTERSEHSQRELTAQLKE
eukprot:5087786-Amphidinium_carterae.1